MGRYKIVAIQYWEDNIEVLCRLCMPSRRPLRRTISSLPTKQKIGFPAFGFPKSKTGFTISRFRDFDFRLVSISFTLQHDNNSRAILYFNFNLRSLTIV